MKPHTLTNSERNVWCRCRHLWALKYGLGLAPRRDKATALRFGSLWHEVMDVLWREGEDVAFAMLDSIISSVERIPAGFFDPLADHQAVDDARRARTLLDVYMLQHRERDWRTVHSEVEFRVLTRNDRIVLGGKVDKIVEVDGQLWLVEHKTSSHPLDLWLTEHGYLQQAQTYAVGARSLGLDVVGVIYDLVLSKEPTPIRFKQDGAPYKVPDRSLPHCTAAEWRKATAGVPTEAWHRRVLDGLMAREQDGYWHRVEFVRFEADDLARFEAEMNELALEVVRGHWRLRASRRAILDAGGAPSAIEEAVRELVMARFTRAPGACWTWGRQCEFFALCSERSREAACGFDVLTNVHPELDGDAPSQED